MGWGVSGRLKLLRIAVNAAVIVVLLEAGSWLAIKVVSPKLDEPIRRTSDVFREQTERLTELLDPRVPTLVTIDSILGWRQRPGYRSAHYTISAQGLRGSREYPATPPAGVLRASAFGASFVFGSEVDDSSAWPALVEREYPGVEVPNYGVGGYGVDQAFLDYVEHGEELHPQAVIIGLTPDDLGRVVNVYRRFVSSLEPPLFKPRFRLAAGGVITRVAAVPPAEVYRQIERHPRDVLAYGRMDYWYKPAVYADPLYDYSTTVRLLTALWTRISRRLVGSDRLYVGSFANPRSEAFRLQVAFLERFADSVGARGARPYVVFFPDRDALARTTRGLPASYQPFLDTLRAHGLTPLDAAAAFPKAGPQETARWLMPGGHYSPAGNRLVAVWLGRVLEARRDSLLAPRARR